MDRETVKSCVFCGIVDGVEEAEIILQNKELVCFHDIDPAAPHHYLVVPRKHVININSLHSGHIQMVKKMADMGRDALVRKGVDHMDNVRIGFHLPPFTSVDHLHLHVLAPASEILYYMSYKFIPKTESFICVSHYTNEVCDMEEDCDFCHIVRGQTTTEIVTSDDELVCFRDVRPGAAHHYLVISRTHIENCRSLGGDHIPLVERMGEMGRNVLMKNNVKDLDDIRLGFHIPPYNSVQHLHLHALAPTSKMDFMALRRYGPKSGWFITVDAVLSQLRCKGKVR